MIKSMQQVAILVITIIRRGALFMNEPLVICPHCHDQEPLYHVLTAQSNQNVIYECPRCHCMVRNIETKKG